MPRLRRKTWWIAAAILICITLLWLRPADRALAPAQRTAGYQPAELVHISTILRREAGGMPCAVIDLDRLDRNIARARQAASPGRLRIVAKSLPSVGLLRYILERSGGRALMVFDAGQLPLLLRELPEPDVLLGKPVPAEAARLALTQSQSAAERVQWLIDGQARLRDYLAVAKSLGKKLRISIELDVGLRRGGVHDEAELLPILDEIAAHPEALIFAGFMGYDGHVPHAPPLYGPGKARAVQKAFDAMLSSYQGFVSAARVHHPEWFALEAPPLTIHSGGSRTVTRYAGLIPGRTVVNDLALGSGLVKPLQYEDPALATFEPALLLANPILKRQCHTPLPFLDGLWGLLQRWDRNQECGFFLYGSTWDGEIVSPRGVAPGYYNDGPIRNLLPNQQLLTGSIHVQAEASDYVLAWPREADNLGAFGRIFGIRGDAVEVRWTPLPFLN